MRSEQTAPVVTFEPTTADDAPALVAIRIAAMRESLERLGRFDPKRARDRFLATFEPRYTRHIVCDDARVGFLALRPLGEHRLLDHLYVLPVHQGRGIGAAALAAVFAEVDAARLSLRVGALRESDANRFYLRHGFVLVERAEWDNYYTRAPQACA
jgi:GNAT superfamily N-acetyltransferase